MFSKPRIIGAVTALLLLAAGMAEAQSNRSIPLMPVGPRAGVSPVFEGWYRNDDGTYTLSFGYINRNRDKVAEVPHGPNNFVEPAEYGEGRQPTRFATFRNYGWFTVNVPADFGDGEVVWTIDHDGRRFSIPGRLSDGYEIDAMQAPATGETPPFLRVMGSEEVRGPAGIEVGPVQARVGEPLSIEVQARDEHADVTIRWYRYSGPGEVTFSEESQPIPQAGGTVVTEVTFNEPGDYVIYARANNSPLVSSGQEQCCWTNGYVHVSVTR